MDSSKRHWPSMFKSKPCNTLHHHQWQHDISPSLISTPTSHKAPYSSSNSVTEDRSPEPKPRWNPKPEQIRILEAIFNSGMVNPPRDEIRRIRAQLQEYGQVGDANVFYWFQNRKSRSKHKQRTLLHNNTTKSLTPKPSPPPTTMVPAATAAPAAPPSSSSSSSDKSSSHMSSVDKAFPVNVMDGLNSPTGSVNQPYFQTTPGEFLPEPFFFPVSHSSGPAGGTSVSATTLTQGFCFSEVLPSNVIHHHVPLQDQTFGNNCSSLFLTDLMNLGAVNYKKLEDQEKIKLQQQQQLGYSVTTAAAPISAQTILPPIVSPSVLSSINHIQGEGLGKSTVFINDVAFEVTSGPFNVREYFGDDAMLIHSSGQPVVTNEWGVTVQSLQHGGFYYLVRMLTPSPHHDLITAPLIWNQEDLT